MLNENVIFEEVPKVSVDEFLPELELEFTDASHDILVNYVLRAITTLCQRANVLRRFVDLNTQPGIFNYALEPVDCMSVLAVMNICFTCGSVCNRHLVKLNRSSCTRPCLCGDSHVWVEHDTELVFDRPGGRYRAEISVMPTREACDVDRVLIDRYLDCIQLGVRGAMYTIADKPWSSIQLGHTLLTQFRQSCASAAVERMTGNMRGAFRAIRPLIF